MGVVLNRATVEEILARTHHIEPGSRPALAARMRHFQRLGFPPGSNTGKGRRAAYGLDELLLFALAFELVQLGVTPERASTLLTDCSEIVLGEAKAALSSETIKGAERLLIIDPRALSSLQGESAAYDDYLMVGGLADVRKRFRSRYVVPRIAIIDLMSVIVALGRVVDEMCADVDVAADWLNWAQRKSVPTVRWEWSR